MAFTRKKVILNLISWKEKPIIPFFAEMLCKKGLMLDEGSQSKRLSKKTTQNNLSSNLILLGWL